MSDQTVSALYNDLSDKLNDLALSIKSTQAMMKILGKEITKLEKSKASGGKKKSTTSSPRNPSGFASPTKMTPELCDFLSVPHDTLMARTEVTRKINAYIKEKDLQNPEARKFILPDDTLTKLLHLESDTKLSYFNLQKYMKHLFVK